MILFVYVSEEIQHQQCQNSVRNITYIFLSFIAQGCGWDTLKSSLEKVQRGEKPPRGFRLVHSMTVEGQKWSVSVGSSIKDERPAMEFYRKGIKGKIAEKRIKIRFRSKQT